MEKEGFKLVYDAPLRQPFRATKTMKHEPTASDLARIFGSSMVNGAVINSVAIERNGIFYDIHIRGTVSE